MIAQLIYNEDDRRFEHDGGGVNCGDALKVLIVNEKGKPEWIETRMEYSDAAGWYLVGLWAFSIGGLFAELL